VIFPTDDQTDVRQKPAIKLRGHIEELNDLILSSSGKLTFVFDITLLEGSHLTADSPSYLILLSGKVLSKNKYCQI
jgi:hypothetical protein